MKIEQAVREARRRKEERVAQLADDADLRPTVFCERSGLLVAVVEAPAVDKEAALFAARVGAQGYGADGLTIILDAHIKLINPGEELPRPGELQRQCDEEGACDLGLISDTLIVQRLSIDGAAQIAILPYKYHGSRTVFHWTKFPFDESEMGFDGYVSDCLAEALAVASRHDLATVLRLRFGLDQCFARRRADQLTTMTLEGMGFTVTAARRAIIVAAA